MKKWKHWAVNSALILAIAGCYEGGPLDLAFESPIVPDRVVQYAIPTMWMVRDSQESRTDRNINLLTGSWAQAQIGTFQARAFWTFSPIDTTIPDWVTVDSAFFWIVPERQAGRREGCFELQWLRTSELPEPLYWYSSVSITETRTTIGCFQNATRIKVPFPIAWAQALTDLAGQGLWTDGTTMIPLFGAIGLTVTATDTFVWEMTFLDTLASHLEIYWHKGSQTGVLKAIQTSLDASGFTYQWKFSPAFTARWQQPVDTAVLLSPMGTGLVVALPAIPDSLPVLSAWIEIRVPHANADLVAEALQAYGYDSTLQKPYPLIEMLNPELGAAAPVEWIGDTARYRIHIPLTAAHLQQDRLSNPLIFITSRDHGRSFSHMVLTRNHVQLYLYFGKNPK